MNDNYIIEYTTDSGKIRYGFYLYIGVNGKTGGSEQVKKQGFKTRIDAEKAYMELKLKVLNGEYIPKSQRKMNFLELYNLWVKQYKKSVRESTFSTTTRYFRDHILPEFSNKIVEKITVLDCQNAVDTWFSDAPRIFKRFIRYTNNVMQYGIDLEAISSNPMKKIIVPKFQEPAKKFTNFYNREELLKFLDCAKKYNYQYFTYFRLLAFTGARRGEALAFRWKDVNFNNKTISITRTVEQGINNRLLISPMPKTKNGVRTIDIDNRTLAVLKEWRLQQQKKMLKLGYNFLNTENLIFPSTKNSIMQPSKVEQWNITICKKYNLRHISIHGFRHTHASLLFESGAKMEDVKERLGHSSITTTMNIYTHVTTSKKKQTALNFAKFMGE